MFVGFFVGSTWFFEDCVRYSARSLERKTNSGRTRESSTLSLVRSLALGFFFFFINNVRLSVVALLVVKANAG